MLTNIATSPQLQSFLLNQAWWVVLLLVAIALVALLFELRLPIRAYWGLPVHIAQQTISRFHSQPAQPIWGHCYGQEDKSPLPMVAIELLNQSGSKVMATTYSDHQGAYGFPLVPGRYLLRATKSHYHQSSFLNPENIEVKSLENSFVTEVTVINDQVAPNLNLTLIPQPSSTPVRTITRIVSTIIFQLGHLCLIASAIISLLAIWLYHEPFFAIILCLCLVLLFIKLYILRMIGWISASQVN